MNEEEYIYVNPKQYLKILQRREKRRKLNLKSRFGFAENINAINETSGQKPKYLHESRHKHAMTRQRGKGGRFVGKKDNSANGEGTSIKVELEYKEDINEN